jgi:Family of unknown function (DUF5996)
MTEAWPDLVAYGTWAATCDTLHAHAQVLGKLAATLAPPEPQLQHAALSVTPRGWETSTLPAPDGSGALLALLDLRTHHVVVEHSDGRTRRVPLAPNRPVGEVTRELLDAVEALVGPVPLNLRPQEVPWLKPLDQDDEHRTYDEHQVADYFAAATQAAVALAKVRAPYRGRSSPVNAWWGTFDLAVSLYSGRWVEPPSDDFISRNSATAEQIEIGWWPGDERYPHPAFFAFVFPTRDGFADGAVRPEAARWDGDLGEYILDWSDVVANSDPTDTVLGFGRSVIEHACTVCEWDPMLANSAQGLPNPLS